MQSTTQDPLYDFSRNAKYNYYNAGIIQIYDFKSDSLFPTKF